MEINLNSIIANKQDSIQEAVGLKVLKDSLEMEMNLSTQLIEALNDPFIGGNIDLES